MCNIELNFASTTKHLHDKCYENSTFAKRLAYVKINKSQNI